MYVLCIHDIFVIVTQLKKRNMQIFLISLYSFSFSSNFPKPSLFFSNNLGVMIIDKCYFSFVCVYFDKNVPLVIVTQLKKEEYVN